MVSVRNILCQSIWEVIETPRAVYDELKKHADLLLWFGLAGEERNALASKTRTPSRNKLSRGILVSCDHHPAYAANAPHDREVELDHWTKTTTTAPEIFTLNTFMICCREVLYSQDLAFANSTPPWTRNTFRSLVSKTCKNAKLVDQKGK